jgi:hypothetical protein
MSRPKIPPEIQARILADSRRRCAICFGLNRDLDRKPGQLAHLDHNAKNNVPENLVFLCMPHHDEYDSRTSQSKGFTKQEVELYRVELISELERLWAEVGLEAPQIPVTPTIVFNVSNVGGAGGAGGLFGGGGGGGGAPMGGGGEGGAGPAPREREGQK